MFFLRQRREKRDQEAGLIFRWRGSKQHHTGKFVALMIAASFFAFSVYAIRIDGGQEAPISKRTGTVFMINEEDPNCYQLLVQIDERSPFPRRWDPAYDADAMGRVSQKVNMLAGQLSKYEPEIRPLPAVEKNLTLPSIVEPDSTLLGHRIKTWELAKAPEQVVRGDVYVRARISADEKISNRLSKTNLSLPQALVAEEWYGQTFRFLVTIDQKGVIKDCLSLSVESLESLKPTEREKLMAGWLRGQRFKPVEDDSVLSGVVELEIEALQE